jgi:hypothetical protein
MCGDRHPCPPTTGQVKHNAVVANHGAHHTGALVRQRRLGAAYVRGIGTALPCSSGLTRSGVVSTHLSHGADASLASLSVSLGTPVLALLCLAPPAQRLALQFLLSPTDARGKSKRVVAKNAVCGLVPTIRMQRMGLRGRAQGKKKKKKKKQ